MVSNIHPHDTGAAPVNLSENALANRMSVVSPSPNTFRGSGIFSRWYAIYTVPRHEKTVVKRLDAQYIENYLPLYSAARVWHGRKVRVELPLFPGYVFAKMCVSDKWSVLALTGVIRLVSFNDNAAALSDDEIDRLKASLAIFKAEPYSFLKVGRCVRVKSGPFVGMEGRILRRKGGMRLVLSLEFIQSAIAVELDAGEIQLAS
jgi:transcription antitermination factor NusG